jgi:hypothetical protein
MFFKSEILQTTHITTAENYLRKAADRPLRKSASFRSFFAIVS